MSNQSEESVPSLLIEHYKAARARIDQEIASMNSYETLVVSAWGAVYAAYFTFKMRDEFWHSACL